MVDIAAAAKITSSEVKLIGGLARWLHDHYVERGHAREVRRLLGLHSGASWSYRVGSHHPHRQAPFPDDCAAFASLAGYDFDRARRAGLLTVSEDVPLTLSDAIVAIGGPLSEAIVRLAFGYEAAPDGGMRFIGEIDLPFRWEHDRNKIHALSRRIAPDGREYEGPNWAIVDTRGDETEYLYPSVDNNRMLEDDLLLVTRVPNYLTLAGPAGNHFLVNIGGTHGIANRAVELLMDRPNVLAEIRTQLAGATSFQVLLRATGVEHDRKKGSRATDLELVAAVPIERTREDWDAAYRWVEQRRARWLTEVGRIPENLPGRDQPARSPVLDSPH